MVLWFFCSRNWAGKWREGSGLARPGQVGPIQAGLGRCQLEPGRTNDTHDFLVLSSRDDFSKFNLWLNILSFLVLLIPYQRKKKALINFFNLNDEAITKIVRRIKNIYKNTKNLNAIKLYDNFKQFYHESKI